ncbi:MAG: helicase, partial [Ruminococcus sp.]|nr:helicase [Ruminococcus sp.]
MPSKKYDIILETLNRVAKDITDRPNNYMSFLITAANNHKYRFEEQLLIYAQKPNATACAEVDTWNKLGRWVNRGTKGIALIVNRNTPYKLRHVFDISDTNSLYGHTVEVWQMNPHYEEAVRDALENSFGESDAKNFMSFLVETARNAVEDNYTDYLEELLDSRRDSFLEELDEFNVDVYFKDLLRNSVGYMLLERCGFDGEEYFDIEDFREIANFNTKETISVLGAASRDISSMVLLEIEKTVRSIKKEEKTQNRTFDKNDESIDNSIEEKSIERSTENDEPNHLQTRGRLLDSESRSTGVPEGGQIWNVATHVSSGTQEREVHEDVHDGKTERASGASGQGSQRNDGEIGEEIGGSSASNGNSQSGGSNV